MADLPRAASNTSPIVALQRIGRIDLVPRLFAQVVVPPAVADELDRFAVADPSLVAHGGLAWLTVRPVVNAPLVESLAAAIHRAEAEAIALAVEDRTDWLLVDEREARAMARRHGLQLTGTLGLLLKAKARGWLPSVAPELDRLRTRGRFWISDDLIRSVLRAAGETPS